MSHGEHVHNWKYNQVERIHVTAPPQVRYKVIRFCRFCRFVEEVSLNTDANES